MTHNGGQDDDQRFARMYAQQSDEDLLKTSAGLDDLTEPAQAALLQELEKRGLEPTPRGIDVLEALSLVTLRQFRDPGDAMVAKTILESAGIEAFLADDNMVRMDWFYSNLLGGIKLKVKAEDVQSADDILNQPVPEEFEVDGAGEFIQPRCPRCNSLEVVFTGLNKPISYATMFINVPIPVKDNTWRCEDCGNQWKETEAEEQSATQ